MMGRTDHSKSRFSVEMLISGCAAVAAVLHWALSSEAYIFFQCWVRAVILWKGNPISCVKTFGTKACKLCAKERFAILNLTRKTPQMSINKNNEVYAPAATNQDSIGSISHALQVTPTFALTSPSRTKEHTDQLPLPQSTPLTHTSPSTTTVRMNYFPR